MRHGRLVLIAALQTMALSGCVTDTRPRTRIHGAATIPRFVDVNDWAFRDAPQGKGPIGASFGFGLGSAWSDVGNVHNGQVYQVGIHYRSPSVAFGWTPYFGYAKVAHEGRGMFGSTLWLSAQFGGGHEWRFSFQPSYTGASKVTEERGCASADTSVFFSDCRGQPESVSRAEVEIDDIGLVLTAEKNIGGHDSFLIAPSVHHVRIGASNQLDVASAADVHRNADFWSPGFQLGVILRNGELSTIAILAGAEWTRTFRPNRSVTQVMPSGSVRFSF